jgi:hypothetical protein
MRRCAGILAAGMLAGLVLPDSVMAADELTGVWTHAWYTRLERPKEFKTLVISPDEAKAYETPRRALSGALPSPPSALGQAESEFMDQGPGLARVRGQIRSSWIVDPADGQIPWKPGALEKLTATRKAASNTSDIENRRTDDRCLTVTGASAPIINSPEANILTIVQTRDAVILAGEKNHEYRIVRLGMAANAPLDPASRLGSSVGHWEGKTLVVTTSGLRDGVQDNIYGVALTEKAKITERFTRTRPTEISYAFEVEDPNLYARPWRAEMVFRPGGPMYEFACHEGNYAMTGMLNASRMEEQEKASSSKSTPP